MSIYRIIDDNVELTAWCSCPAWVIMIEFSKFYFNSIWLVFTDRNDGRMLKTLTLLVKLDSNTRVHQLS